MHHLVVKRVFVLLVILLVVAVILFGVFVS
jgi:hypothetical protein